MWFQPVALPDPIWPAYVINRQLLHCRHPHYRRCDQAPLFSHKVTTVANHICTGNDARQCLCAIRTAPATNTVAQVRTLMAQGEKIEAIKILRERTGMGLAEAKAAVERLDEGGNLDNPLPSSSAPAQLPVELAATVRGLLQSGDKIAAIKLVRERMKLDLKDSKELVDKFD